MLEPPHRFRIEAPRCRYGVARNLHRDDRSTRRSFADAYDELLPIAVRLAAGREMKTDIVAPGGLHAEGVVIALRDR